MIRTRFAPSPTGYLHVGGLRTALYNYLYAHKHKGTFILRIEDTDKERFVEGATENLINTLKRVGLDFDEGPYIQSERLEHYKKYIQELLDKGVAYKCYCTPERLEDMRNKQSEAKQAPMYDRKCLNQPERKEAFVIRQKIPHDQKIKFKDHIRGFVKFDGSTIDDQVLMKSDGYPTYHLANVVDDHLMEITHVIRGEEWLPSTPKHVLLYEAFGWKPPDFAHIPLLLNKDKSKLSKRQGNVSVEYYLDEGYIKEAIINFIALLGWHPGKGEEKEIFSLAELIDVFSLEQVHKGGAIFDEEKLQWFNFKWQKSLHHQKLAEIAKKLEGTIELNQKKEPVYSFANLENEKSFVLERAQLLLSLCKYHIPKEWLKEKFFLSKALITIEEKILKNPKETEELLKFYYELGDYDKSFLQHEKMKVDEQTAKKSLEESLKSLEEFDHFDNLNAIQEHLLDLVQKLELKNGQVLWPLRVALSGEQYSPGTFELFWVLGKDESLKRIKAALKKF